MASRTTRPRAKATPAHDSPADPDVIPSETSPPFDQPTGVDAAAPREPTHIPPYADPDDPDGVRPGMYVGHLLPNSGYTSIGLGSRSFRVDPLTDRVTEEIT